MSSGGNRRLLSAVRPTSDKSADSESESPTHSSATAIVTS